jgi:tetratricopeptide (TPR) repeat protein
MTQQDYILRMMQSMGRVLAQVLYQCEIKDYQGALDLIDEQFKQALGMGRGFIHSMPDETLLAMLTSLGILNVEKCWLVAALLKAEGEVYEDKGDANESFYSYLKACNLFLEAALDSSNTHTTKNVGIILEVEEILSKIEEYELPPRTKQLLFSYFERTGRYAKAEEMLFEALEADSSQNMLAQGIAFYRRLLRKSDTELHAGNISRKAVGDVLARLESMK